MFMAVHEIEAWFLSQPEIFRSIGDQKVYETLKKENRPPEEIDFDKPPKKLLHKIYCEKTDKGYKARVHGYHLFRKLDPSAAYQKCPYLRKMLDEMLRLANDTGL
jgi:hypothetical protein